MSRAVLYTETIQLWVIYNCVGLFWAFCRNSQPKELYLSFAALKPCFQANYFEYNNIELKTIFCYPKLSNISPFLRISQPHKLRSIYRLLR